MSWFFVGLLKPLFAALFLTLAWAIKALLFRVLPDNAFRDFLFRERRLLPRKRWRKVRH